MICISVSLAFEDDMFQLKTLIRDLIIFNAVYKST